MADPDMATIVDALLTEGYRGPVLAFHLPTIRTGMLELRRLTERHGASFLMAVKAGPHPAVLDLARHLLAGFDVSGPREYRLLPADLTGCEVSVTGPTFDPGVAAELGERGNALTINLGSETQWTRLARCEGSLRYGLRVDATSLLGEASSRGEPWAWQATSGLHSSRFGEGVDRWVEAGAMTAPRDHRFVGFHVHHGGRDHDAAIFERLASALASAYASEVERVNLGGGLHNLTLPDLSSLLETLRATMGPVPRIFFEPGDLLFRDAGFALGRVELVRARGRTLCCTLDLSKLCHLHWSRPRLLHPGVEVEAGHGTRVLFFGPTCSEKDFLCEAWLAPSPAGAPRLRRGEHLLFGGVTGYSMAWNQGFGESPPAEVRVVESW